MRGMFGLVGLLVMIGLMALVFKMFEAPTLEQGKKTQDQVQQISGRGQDGRSAMESFKVDPEQQGNRLSALRVTQVVPGGAVDEYYGLKAGDRITQITTQAGLQKINEASNNDAELAKALVQTAFQGAQPIVVIRNGQPLTLPAPAVTAAAPASAAPEAGTPPAQPAAAPPPPRGNVWDQVNNIKNSVQDSSK